MATATKTTPDKGTGLAPEEKAWLGRYLGSRVPWKTTIVQEGEEIDAEEAYARLKEYDAAVKAGEDFEGIIPVEMEQTRKALAAIGIPSKVDRGTNFEASR